MGEKKHIPSPLEEKHAQALGKFACKRQASGK